MKKHTVALASAVSIILALMSMNAAAQDRQAIVSLSTGMEFTSGSFGGAGDIEDLYVPVTASVDYGRLGFSLTVPYLSVTTPSETGPDGEPESESAATISESGLGDVIGSVTIYDVILNRDRALALDVTGTIKVGTADEDKGLGTGENDYSVRLEAYKFYEHFTLLAFAGYKLRGEPDGVDLDNVFLGSIGGAYQTASQTLFGFYYDFRQSALHGSDDVHELTGFASMHLNSNWQLEAYAFTGFTDGSPDWGGGMLVSTDLPRFRIRDDR